VSTNFTTSATRRARLLRRTIAVNHTLVLNDEKRSI
jgi:hypothetical protein